MTIIDLFAGPGGWDHGLREHVIGLDDAVGVEWDDDAVATRCAANLMTVHGDVAELDPETVAPNHSIEGLIASPPCQPFSRAGKRDGMRDLIRLGSHVERVADRHWRSYDATSYVDPRAGLILEPLRWAIALEPRWVALEQVPPCLPMWEVVGEVLHAWGYSVWTGVLNAADYGVPQTRQRAFLMAHTDRFVGPPTPTHAEEPGLGQERWVTMAEALGWRAHDAEPAAAVTGKGTAYWTRNDQSGTDEIDRDWPYERPATTVAGRDLVADPGANANRYNGKQKSRNDGVRVTVEQAAVLQGFPADYPWQGSKTSRFAQVGNAVPPLLAAHVVGALVGQEVRT